MRRKIIVVTPVKNESWILETFLKITSQFADAIIIADQFSTDRSSEIIQRFNKAILIKNESLDYNEAYRQFMLLEKARELFPGTKVILALDADELLAASSFSSPDFNLMQNADPGSVFYFEKPDIYGHISQCIRNPNNDYPMGFVDDDSIEHQPKLIHSFRIPRAEGHTKVFLRDMKFLHVSYLRPNAQRAKYRFYMVKENILATSAWFRRRKRYRSPNHLLPWATISATLPEWINYPAHLDISLESIKDEITTWHDEEVLKDLLSSPSFRFWLDDIWDMDWNAMANRYADGKKSAGIVPPPKFLKNLLKQFDKIY